MRFRDVIGITFPKCFLVEYLDRNAFKVENFRNHFQFIPVMPGGDDVMMRNQAVHQPFAVWHADHRPIQTMAVLKLGIFWQISLHH